MADKQPPFVATPKSQSAAGSVGNARERNESSPLCQVVEITSSLTINNVSKYTALARARRKIMFVARRTTQNHLALHYLKEHGCATPDGVLLKDNQVQVLTSSETTGLLDLARATNNKHH